MAKYGAITRRKGTRRHAQWQKAYERDFRSGRTFGIRVHVMRSGIGGKNLFHASACVGRKTRPSSTRMGVPGRCWYGGGPSPTAAVKQALHRLADFVR